MTMSHLLVLLGILALAAAPCHARDCREMRVMAKPRTGPSERGQFGAQLGGNALPRNGEPENGAAESDAVPVAIDSETGEVYWVQPGQGLTRKK